ncbi:MAG: hypothetical protein JY451_02275 [Erythrobacter sp.]|nr:MAG: hypothetical protein JY451_02275 [Erythrobacter sp.]
MLRRLKEIAITVVEIGGAFVAVAPLEPGEAARNRRVRSLLVLGAFLAAAIGIAIVTS